ncbi:MAG: ATP-dependent RNA helicase HrpA [Deltaproteobacteria bacterium]|nr:ATP-dependent RNA helicase HrpA [Deltaproteobacteria bacterium]
MCVDRPRIYRELARIKKNAKESAPNAGLLKKLEQIKKSVKASAARAKKRKKHLPHPTYNEDLPITLRKDEIIDHIINHQVVIVSGETGSGKTTQIPKFCLAAGRGVSGKIGCTQPRRIAAITIASRIAEEMGEPAGQSVGYKIRFQDRVSPESYIKIMTDGILLAEAQKNRFLNEYDTIIIDEAHERSLNIDFCIGILKTLLMKRPDLKLIITSATIDTEKFSKAFNNAPVIEVSGRMYPVDVKYIPQCSNDQDSDDDGKEEVTHVDMAVDTVETLYRQNKSGDILVFMPTEQDIRETCDMIEGRHFKNTVVIPLFARLPAKEQSRIFKPERGRKIIVATNIAETSITIPGIKYVIDTGLARISSYSPRSRTTSLPVIPISKSSADQRKGRCGRIENGVCIRLFSEDDFQSRPVYTSPEILRANLADVVLRMTSLKLGDINKFPFIDPPPSKHIKDGYDLLLELNAIKISNGKQRYTLTQKGGLMSKIPLDPGLSAMLIEAGKLGCIREMAIITSVLSIRDPRERPPGKEAESDKAHESFQDPLSDFMTLFNIWGTYHRTLEKQKNNNKMKKFCREKFISFRRMREWRDIHRQISLILSEHGLSPTRHQARSNQTSLNQTSLNKSPQKEKFSQLYTAIHKSILSGYLSNIALKKENNIFQAAKGREVMIFPGSTLFNRPGKWIVAAEMIETSKLFARTAANIDSTWLEEPAQFLCKKIWLHPRWERNRGEVVADEQVSLFGLIIIPKRPVAFGKIDPEKASKIFIRKALVEGDVKKPFAFMQHNQSLIDEVKDMEDRIRKRDILVSEDDLFQFYNKRLSGIHDLKSLKTAIKKKGDDDFLKMTEDNLLSYRPDQAELSLFPYSIPLGDNHFECEYSFNPGQKDDGITVKIPAHKAENVTATKLDWIVPGMFYEKVTAMIKGLPKEFRKQLVPVSNTVDIIVNDMPRNRNENFYQALGNFIYEKFNINIPRTAWPEDLPDHLNMRIAIIDPEGRTILCSRDKQVLNKNISCNMDSDIYQKARAKWEKSDIKKWDFPDLPKFIRMTEHDGDAITLFPGLKDNDGSVSIHLFSSQKDALKCHKNGVKALFCIHFTKNLKSLKRYLSLPMDLKKASVCLGGYKNIEKCLHDRVVHDLFSKNIRSSKDFYMHAESSESEIIPNSLKLMENAAPVIRAMFKTMQTIHRLETGNQAGNGVNPFLNRLQNELRSLVPENFIPLYELRHFSDLVRYIKGIGIRAGRAVANPEKEQSKADKIQKYEKSLQRLLDELKPETSEEKKRETEEYFWMLEEYKISVFAQEIKTAFPVSKKKLDDKLKKISRMA